MNQREIIASLPVHLRPFVTVQQPEHYSPRDHALWRFIMRHLTRQLDQSAHPVYREGLARTGISLDQIPSIDAMNAQLEPLGWRALVVDGFIPPAVFMEFQSLKILVIALDMRSVEHIFHTPAPDIVHESAGHAPFIVDIDYAEFLQRFGEIGAKAIPSREDMALYEAIRHLSIVKECGDSTEADIAAAEARLRQASAASCEVSEASLLSRLHWWTVEYGLVGSLEDYKIFGAGLLSSLGESRHCLDDQRVKKLPLTVNAVSQPYDITAEQPQLYVTRSCRHLSQVLEEFARTMAYQRGGAAALQKAVQAGTVCTALYDSGVQVSGVMQEVLCDAVGNAVYLRTAGPTQLAYRDCEVFGHGVERHARGFGSPIGQLKDFSRCLSLYTIDELKAHDIAIDRPVTLEYLSGITVRGVLRQVFRQEHRNLILEFDDCTVTDLDGNALFRPEWGAYDLVVGSRVTSVYGGVADKGRWQLFALPPASKTVRKPADSALMGAYQRVASLRVSVAPPDRQTLEYLHENLHRYPREWLLRVEMLAVADPSLRQRAAAELQAIPDVADELADLVAADIRAEECAVKESVAQPCSKTAAH
ncbi:aromatic amino acid hydroxylase [Haliea sp. E17]|uniref:aromatic amino acid hydroxylase n=1 Tax=Haliea sp. E17 TaxID=3401576 RepID=UPI003AAD6437